MLTNQVEAISHSIFRAYDIRGVVGKTLTTDVVFAIGQAIGTVALEKGDTAVAVGRDGRLSGPSLSLALCEGILASGCDVIHLGLVPTPLLYYATFALGTSSGVMLTGSHNPPDYNGLKIVISGETLAEDGIQDLYYRITENRLASGAGSIRDVASIDQYINRITSDVKLKRPLKIVVDCGNGVPGIVVGELYRQLGCEVHEIFCDVDGNFPNHHPDPSQTENLQDLIDKVKELNADIGLAFDGDGDRLGLVTNTGEVIWPDRQLMLLAKSVLSRNPGALILYDVKCTSHLAPVIESFGGVPLMWKTGHSLIKAKLKESNALLAGEMSGHFFIKERWYGFDDAIYAGARMLEILAEQSLTSDQLFKTVPNSVNTPELKIDVNEEEKFGLMQRLVDTANFADKHELVTIDGLRVNFENGWGLVRPSNTTPCLVLRFEATNATVLNHIQNVFREFLLSVDPALNLPF